MGETGLTTDGLRDASLVLRMGRNVIGNDVHAGGRSLLVITGANQGGKSTLLRGAGLALLMMQSGMFVTAKGFRASVSTGVFTHYKREEDTTMTSGKLDEELGRMNDIVDHLRPGGTVLFNESFAATNEREGSEIGRQIVHALQESGVRVILVTHLFDLANGLHDEHSDTAIFLRADRQGGGHSTFRITEGAPLPTSYGIDLQRCRRARRRSSGSSPRTGTERRFGSPRREWWPARAHDLNMTSRDARDHEAHFDVDASAIVALKGRSGSGAGVRAASVRRRSPRTRAGRARTPTSGPRRSRPRSGPA